MDIDILYSVRVLAYPLRVQTVTVPVPVRRTFISCTCARTQFVGVLLYSVQCKEKRPENGWCPKRWSGYDRTSRTGSAAIAMWSCPASHKGANLPLSLYFASLLHSSTQEARALSESLQRLASKNSSMILHARTDLCLSHGWKGNF